MAYLPARGHALWLSLSPTLGHEQGGRRPVLVLSPDFYNRRSGLLVACPITSRAKGYPFEVPIPAGLSVSGVILADQVRSLDWSARTIEPIGPLPDDLVQEVLARSRTLLS
ncbi:MAG: type II toxin-antitoxin system PemK/MazF family toxin [Thermoanaerobaculia bacterium]